MNDLVNLVQHNMKIFNDHRKASAQNMRLGELIAALEARPQDHFVRFDFCGFRPKRLISYRGYYEDLAIEPTAEHNDKRVSDFVAELKEAVGQTYEGYKGGDFTMTKDTLMWVAPYGESHGTAVAAVAGNDYETVIATAWLRT